MKKIFILFLFSYFSAKSQSFNAQFNQIRNNSAKLRAFFSAMPKGGDLHHHFSGAVYAETFVNFVIEKDYWLNINTIEIKSSLDQMLENDKSWKRFSDLKAENSLPYYTQKCLEKWSAKDFVHKNSPSDDHFFDTFIQFNIANKDKKTGLLELKNRAKVENVQYIETMFSADFEGNIPNDESIDLKLRAFQKTKNSIDLQLFLDSLYVNYLNLGIEKMGINQTRKLENFHKSLNLDDDSFTLRFQNAIYRLRNPSYIFADLMVAFI